MINIGLDTGRERHQFHIVDATDGIRETRDTGCLPNASWAYEAWAGNVESTYGADIQLAIESCNGLASPLDQYLAERGWRILQIPPATVKSYRENVMGQQNKTDATDAHALALLACDAAARFECRKQPRPTLRRLTRYRSTLIKEHTQTCNRLRQALSMYWPEATGKVIPDLAAGYILTILERHPDPFPGPAPPPAPRPRGVAEAIRYVVRCRAFRGWQCQALFSAPKCPVVSGGAELTSLSAGARPPAAFRGTTLSEGAPSLPIRSGRARAEQGSR